MGKIFLDATLPGKLLGLTQPADVCESSGRIVGRFIPLCHAVPAAPPPLSEEELRRREEEPEYSTAEVLAHLEKQ